MSIREYLGSSVSCLGIHLAHILWNVRLLYTPEYNDPWTMLNFYAISSTMTLRSSRTMALASSNVFVTGSCWGKPKALFISHICLAFLVHFFSIVHTFPRNSIVPRLCTQTHVISAPCKPSACKNGPQISVRPWYKLKVLQSYSLLDHNSHNAIKGETISEFKHHIPVTVLPTLKGLAHIGDCQEKRKSMENFWRSPVAWTWEIGT